MTVKASVSSPLGRRLRRALINLDAGFAHARLLPLSNYALLLAMGLPLRPPGIVGCRSCTLLALGGFSPLLYLGLGVRRLSLGISVGSMLLSMVWVIRKRKVRDQLHLGCVFYQSCSSSWLKAFGGF